MAWIVKNSATMQVDRRDEPYLDESLIAELEEQVLPCYPTRRAATLPVLHAIQHRYNWIPHQAIEEAAKFLQMSAAELLDTATFYEDFWLKPKGKYLIAVCRSISCELMGQPALLQRIQAKLGIGPGQTTDDGRFTLVEVECLGACDTGPCALMNETLRERLTFENFQRILESLE